MFVATTDAQEESLTTVHVDLAVAHCSTERKVQLQRGMLTIGTRTLLVHFSPLSAHAFSLQC